MTNITCNETKENQKTRPLGLLIEVVEKMGLQVTYAYDDFVFIEHNAFIFQFPETSGVNIYFNKECPDTDAEEILQKITSLAKENEMEISRKGTFVMQQVEGEENIRIEMLDDPE